MSDKNEAIAESIIRNEAYALRAAKGFGKYCEARAALKDRLIRELDLAEARGAGPC